MEDWPETAALQGQVGMDVEVSLHDNLSRQLAQAHAEVSRLTMLLALLEQNLGTAQILDLMSKGRKNNY
jgi:hypothetical protein